MRLYNVYEKRIKIAVFNDLLKAEEYKKSLESNLCKPIEIVIEKAESQDRYCCEKFSRFAFDRYRNDGISKNEYGNLRLEPYTITLFSKYEGIHCQTGIRHCPFCGERLIQVVKD